MSRRGAADIEVVEVERDESWGDARFCTGVVHIQVGHPETHLCSAAPHSGPHSAFTLAACEGCGGHDLHSDECPNIGETGGIDVELRWTDRGRAWIEPVKAAADV